MTEPQSPGCVFDCMVLLQAAARPEGPAGGCVQAVWDGTVQLHMSAAIIRELRAVLTYPAVRRRFPELTSDVSELFVERIRWRSIYHRDVPHRLDLPRDPKDEPYVDLAVHVGADVLTTRDRDLLDLVEGRDEAAKTLRRLAPTLQILRPEELLQELAARAQA